MENTASATNIGRFQKNLAFMMKYKPEVKTQDELFYFNFITFDFMISKFWWNLQVILDLAKSSDSKLHYLIKVGFILTNWGKYWSNHNIYWQRICKEGFLEVRVDELEAGIWAMYLRNKIGGIHEIQFRCGLEVENDPFRDFSFAPWVPIRQTYFFSIGQDNKPPLEKS